MHEMLSSTQEIRRVPAILRKNVSFLLMLAMFVACALVAMALSGCRKAATGDQRDVVVIAKEELLLGWRLMPQSEMPPNDKMPWWLTNPQTLNAPLPDEFVLDLSRPSATSHVSRVRAAIYEKGHDGVLIFWLRFQTVDAMAAEFDIIARNLNAGSETNAEEYFLGMDRKDEKAFVHMGISLRMEAKDRQFFVDRFHALTSDRAFANATSQPR